MLMPEFNHGKDGVIFVRYNLYFILQSDTLAAGLLSLGLKKGDRVGIWGPNSYEWILTQYATARVGIILVSKLLAFFLNFGYLSDYSTVLRIVECPLTHLSIGRIHLEFKCCWVVSFNFIQISKVHPVRKKSTESDQTLRFAGSDLVLHCLLIFH